MKVAVGQINPLTGDWDGNADRIIAAASSIDQAWFRGSEPVLVLPRFALSGTGLGDMTGSPDMVKGMRAAETKIAVSVPAWLTVVYRTVSPLGVEEVIVARAGVVKRLAGDGTSNLVSLGEDWVQIVLEGKGVNYKDVTEENLIVLAADPYTPDAIGERVKRVDDLMWATWCRNAVYVNLVGGQDELVYDGMSLIMDRNGAVVDHLPRFEEEGRFVDTDALVAGRRCDLARDEVADTYRAIVLGVRDYARRNQMGKVVLGASGGIDSALVLTIAADAIGAENVIGISMPSEYSSQHSQDDAEELMRRLEGEFRKVPIAPMVDVFQDALALDGVAEENLQARVRGVIVMGVANTENALLLEPGNASEAAVGYATIYGDTVGGYAPISDVYKTDVYRLAAWRNTLPDSPIPESTMMKAPSAELRPGQVDSDSLPDYEVLDAVLRDMFEGGLEFDRDALYAHHDKDVVDLVLWKVRTAEWKRRQTAFGPRVSSYSFAHDRRVPVSRA